MGFRVTIMPKPKPVVLEGVNESVWCEMDDASLGGNLRNRKLEPAQPSSATVGPAPGSALTRCEMLKLPVLLGGGGGGVSKG